MCPRLGGPIEHLFNEEHAGVEVDPATVVNRDEPRSVVSPPTLTPSQTSGVGGSPRNRNGCGDPLTAMEKFVCKGRPTSITSWMKHPSTTKNTCNQKAPPVKQGLLDDLIMHPSQARTKLTLNYLTKD